MSFRKFKKGFVNYKADLGVFAWVGVDKNKQWMCTGQMSGSIQTRTKSLEKVNTKVSLDVLHFEFMPVTSTQTFLNLKILLSTHTC